MLCGKVWTGLDLFWFLPKIVSIDMICLSEDTAFHVSFKSVCNMTVWCSVPV